ncbi:hypothetical protein [Bifidobacterium jacchi]|uniref:Uncharacterized protein n=1 Tax=Bifidobacterium jacchi TaxID=2490545 RepID=A0A5N5RNE0_9BIFI|nr:hypothetical protein [Bifidobacterium jacchi]KAB5608281.1 hypothetical protein EHS19_01215 [Bifidobacterium jacchi]
MNIRQAIEQRRNICDEDYIMVEKAWQDMINACTDNVENTIRFVDEQCTADELSWLSEIYDELIEQTQSPQLVVSLLNAIIRNPEEDKRYSLMPILDESVATYGNHAVKSAYRRAKEDDAR